MLAAISRHSGARRRTLTSCTSLIPRITPENCPSGIMRSSMFDASGRVSGSYSNPIPSRCMSGPRRGRYLDNIFIERLWRSLKYEEVFLKAYATVAEARHGIGDWLSFYNDERPHQALEYRTPREVFLGMPACGDVDNKVLPTSPQDPSREEKDCIYRCSVVDTRLTSLACGVGEEISTGGGLS